MPASHSNAEFLQDLQRLLPTSVVTSLLTRSSSDRATDSTGHRRHFGSEKEEDAERPLQLTLSSSTKVGAAAAPEEVTRSPSPPTCAVATQILFLHAQSLDEWRNQGRGGAGCSSDGDGFRMPTRVWLGSPPFTQVTSS